MTAAQPLRQGRRRRLQRRSLEDHTPTVRTSSRIMLQRNPPYQASKNCPRLGRPSPLARGRQRRRVPASHPAGSARTRTRPVNTSRCTPMMARFRGSRGRIDHATTSPGHPPTLAPGSKRLPRRMLVITATNPVHCRRHYEPKHDGHRRQPSQQGPDAACRQQRHQGTSRGRQAG